MNHKLNHELVFIWHLIWKLDKWAHLAGAFILTTVAMRFTPMPVAVAILILGSIALEAYQHQYEPDYPTKRLDTALDLIADGIGIAMAVMV